MVNMNKIYCQHCGKLIRNPAKYCPVCGKALEYGEVVNDPQNVKSNDKRAKYLLNKKYVPSTGFW